MLETNARTAEMANLTENAFGDVNIAFANELSIISDKLDIDVWELIKLANHHPRVNILQPGSGVGGHCIAVDPWFIVDATPKQARLIHTARNVNDSKPDFIIEKVMEAIKGLDNPKVACLGLSFKANIDDLRESPAVGIVKKLSLYNLGAIYVVEPHITKLPNAFEKSDVILTDTNEPISNADVVVLLVEHDQFKLNDSSIFNGKVLIDSKGFYSIQKEKVLSV